MNTSYEPGDKAIHVEQNKQKCLQYNIVEEFSSVVLLTNSAVKLVLIRHTASKPACLFFIPGGSSPYPAQPQPAQQGESGLLPAVFWLSNSSAIKSPPPHVRPWELQKLEVLHESNAIKQQLTENRTFVSFQGVFMQPASYVWQGKVFLQQ